MAREYQDYSFKVTQVAGLKLVRLVGAVDENDDDMSPCVVFAKFDDSKEWHRFFLQAQIAFWEIWDDATINDEFDDYIDDEMRLVDYSNSIGGCPCTIESAEAFEDDCDLTHIRLLFQNGFRMTLEPDSADIDTSFHVVFS